MNECNFNVAIAIDFGTDGLGVAYAFQNEIYIHNKWNSKRYGSTSKPKTIMLLDDDQEIVAVGMDAKHAYMSLAGTQKDEWMLFERFKMSLYEDKLNELNQTDIKENEYAQIDISNELIAVNGKTCRSEKVFVDVFKHIHKQCMKYLRKKKIKVKHDEIQWIITVPAIWNDNAKYKMKEWTIKSGLVDEKIKNQCKIVYEPDCASLAIQYHLKKINNIHYNQDDQHKKNNDKNVEQKELIKGEKYILIDAGGGTVDVACHEIVGEFGVKEIMHPSGGKWGSCYIDDQYVLLLETIFCKQWIEEFKKASPNVYVEMIFRFQSSKATFYSNPNIDSHNIELPFHFLSFLEEKIEDLQTNGNNQENKEYDVEAIENMVKNAKINGISNLIVLEEETLKIDNIVWKLMFDHVINPTVEHIKKLLDEIQLKDCKYLCLVGGLSCSPYFQYRMSTEFGLKSQYKLKIIIPNRPILSVVEGAAYFGITKNYIKARRLQKTYGQVVSLQELHAKEIGIPFEYIEEKKFYHKPTSSFWVSDLFHIYAKKNEEIYMNEIRSSIVERWEYKNFAKVELMCSDLVDPKLVTDGKILANIQIDFDENSNDLEMQTEFHFYETLLRVFVYRKTKPNKKKEVEIKYNNNNNNKH